MENRGQLWEIVESRGKSWKILAKHRKSRKNNNGTAFGGAPGALRAPGVVVFIDICTLNQIKTATAATGTAATATAMA